MIRFACSNCGQRISVSDRCAGRQGRCPSCKKTVLVPNLNDSVSADAGRSPDSTAAPGAAFLDEAIFDIPPKQQPSRPPTPQPGVPNETLQQPPKPETDVMTAHAEPVVERRLPWFVDIFLYPANASGLTIIGIVAGIPLLFAGLVWILGMVTAVFPPMFAGLVIVAVIGFIVRIVLYLYLCWYLCECIRHSAQGGRRAPQTMPQTPDIGEILLQFFTVLVCLIVFWGPVVLWYFRTLCRFLASLFTRGAPTAVFQPAIAANLVITVLLLAYAIFFFPMALLAVVMFDSLSGLNPVLIVQSIYGTFRRYCGMLLVFCLLWALAVQLSHFATLYSLLSPLAAVFLSGCIGIYTLMVQAHILGRFYCKNEQALYWDA